MVITILDRDLKLNPETSGNEEAQALQWGVWFSSWETQYLRSFKVNPLTILWSLLTKKQTNQILCNDKSLLFHTKVHCDLYIVLKFFTWLIALIFSIRFTYCGGYTQNHHRDGLRLGTLTLLRVESFTINGSMKLQ